MENLLKKKFLRFQPHVDQECRFLRDCNESKAKYCEICRVILMRDRFLGEEFHKKIEQKRSINPYILIVNSAGCNMNCWFCYAHDMIKPVDYNVLSPVFNSPEELAECFICKMNMAKKINQVDKDRFFSRIRITGGEPLYSTDDTINNRGDRSCIEATIDYYLKFFREMDYRVRGALKSGIISLAELQKYSPAMYFPTWLASKPDRINIRFDTNGLLFSKKENAKRFIEGVINCRLRNLRIEIDYSLKGAAPIEYRWALGKSLPVGEASIEDYDIKDHPQYPGLINIIEIKEELKNGLGDSFSLTVERGINHGKTNGFVNFPTSLNWGRFLDSFNMELRLRGLPEIEISDVDNPIQYAKQWGYLFGRYHSRGACVRVQTGDDVIDYLPWDSQYKEKELISYIKRCKNERRPYKLVFFPCSRESYNAEQTPSTVDKKSQLEKDAEKAFKTVIRLPVVGNVWVLTGKLDNWEYSISHELWGVEAKHKASWDVLDVGDLAFFYVSRPVGGLIGCGTIISKYYDTALTWQNEILENRSIYPYKMKFKIVFAVPKHNWFRDAIEIKRTSIPFRHGINLVEDEIDKEVLKRKVKRNWNTEISY